jgi:hypothetical protein
MIDKEDFHSELIQSILSDAESRGLMNAQCFFETVCEELTELGDLTKNYTTAEYKKRGVEVYGYDFDEERKILSIISLEFYQEDEIQTLSKDLVSSKFKRLRTFFERSIEELHKELEPTSEAFSMSYQINSLFNSNDIEKVRLMIISDGKASRNIKTLPSENIHDIEFEYNLIDIDYLFAIHKNESQNVDYDIDVNLPFLKINSSEDPYESYLSVLSGDLIYDIYDKYGKKILEQNVRTFLQFRGNVNKGLRNTIEQKPEMFFAYNNGVTATATNVEIKNDRIVKIHNFQVVNGGQTTSAIFAAKKKRKDDLSKVSVQMKLSVVNPEFDVNQFVSKVAEYANTQNKVNPSDFFSNSPFHKDMKEYSNRIWAPSTSGIQQKTRWYYERVRGEYLNEQAYLTTNKKKQFLLENPRDQQFEKTYVSKCENSWQQLPHIVAKGGQYSFKHFSATITDLLDKNDQAITENYFKDAISRIILFKHVERLISKSDWYDGGYRAQAVTYSISLLSYTIQKQGKFLNFNYIWEKQSIPHNLDEILNEITERVYESITNPPAGSANASSFAKKIECWERVKRIPILSEIDEILLIGKEEKTHIKRAEKKEKKILQGIEMQVFVIETPKSKWKLLFDYFDTNFKDSKISNMQYDILRKYAKGILPYPSEKQSKIIYGLYELAKSEGFEID